MSRLRLLTPILLLCAMPALRAQPDPAAVLKSLPAYPAAVTLQKDTTGYFYRRAGTSEPLYTYDRDRPGQSVCYEGCASAWPPLAAPQDAVPVGEWTLVVRSDGSRQWALNGKPVYTRIHDKPEAPGGDGMQGVWHLVASIPPNGAR